MLERIGQLAELPNPPELTKQSNVVVNFGDATLLTSLKYAAAGNRVIIVDPNEDVPSLVLTQLNNGDTPFGFFPSRLDLQQQYASIHRNVLQLGALISREYQSAWIGARTNLASITHLPKTIEQVLEKLGDNVWGLADVVTYHYPSPAYNPRFAALELASRILKPQGKFLVTTEDDEVFQTFRSMGGKFVESAADITGKTQDSYCSAYDLVLGERGRYRVVIHNLDGGLAEYVNTIKANFWFKAMALLGMVK